MDYTVKFDCKKNPNGWISKQIRLLEILEGLGPYRMNGWYGKKITRTPRYGEDMEAIIFRWRKPKYLT